MIENPEITYKLQEFEGPLDLLLRMIEREELDITEVSLAAIADQFVKYIENHPEISGAELTDFLLVATQLLLLKSGLLLPKVEVEEDINPDILQTQLKLYRKFVDTAAQLQTKINQKAFLYHRQKSPITPEPAFSPPKEITADLLYDSLQTILKRLEPIVILDESVIEKTVTLHQKMLDIRDLIKRKSGLSFKSLLAESETKMEKIVSFLALLELVKQEEIEAIQSNAFADIQINKPS